MKLEIILYSDTYKEELSKSFSLIIMLIYFLIKKTYLVALPLSCSMWDLVP